MCGPATATPAVRLPTDGYVRPGRYFPVGADGPVTLTADGCVPCDVATRGTVPMLAVSTPGELRGGSQPLPLRVPAAGERLVGLLSGTVPADLFPGSRVIPVRLDPADPLPGPAAAWEVLDAVVLDGPAMAALDDGHRSALLAGGVELAVVGGPVPDRRWPWERRGAAWALAYAPAGPAGAVDADAYGPAAAWAPGWSVAVRRAAAAVAGGIAVAAVLAGVVPRRARVVGPVIVCVAGAAGVAIWRATLDPVARGGGDVVVAGGGWRQRDAWVYDRARAAADLTVPWKGWTHPVLAGERTATADRLRLVASADGGLAFTVRLPAGTTVAFVRRDVGPGDVPPVTGGRGAAMRDVAGLYLSAGDRVAGETAAPPGRWPGVVVVRRPVRP